MQEQRTSKIYQSIDEANEPGKKSMVIFWIRMLLDLWINSSIHLCKCIVKLELL